MKFKDAAFEILKQAGNPLHYQEITKRALFAGLLDTTGRTPESSMGALLYTDTLKPESRFRRGDKAGTFTLKIFTSNTFQQQLDSLLFQFRKDLRNTLKKIDPQKFEELIRLLLEEMGFEETVTTAYSNDKGVDVRGILRSNPLSEVKIAIQAKRWDHKVGSNTVRNLRGSLKVADSEQGLIITPSDFTPSAYQEAQESGKTPIRLINGDQLVDLLIQYHIGVRTETYTIPTIDEEYWSEMFGIPVTQNTLPFQEEKPKKTKKPTLGFPINIQGKYKNKSFTGLLLSIEGIVSYDGKEFLTPTAAAKAIVEWKTVNGWDFWRYEDPTSGKFERIGKLRK